MKALSPGLRGTSYPGCAVGHGINPERVGSSAAQTAVHPKACRRKRIVRGSEATLTGLAVLSMREPRVARTSQPWAKRYNPLGIAEDVQPPEQIGDLLRSGGGLHVVGGKVEIHGTTGLRDTIPLGLPKMSKLRNRWGICCAPVAGGTWLVAKSRFMALLRFWPVRRQPLSRRGAGGSRRGRCSGRCGR
jgi:hypothetical protein